MKRIAIVIVLLSLGTYIAAMTIGSSSRSTDGSYWANFAARPGKYLYESAGIRRGMWMVGWYRDLLEGTGGANGFPDPQSGYQGLADFVAELASEAGLPTRLSQCGVEEAKLSEMAAEAAKQWTGTFNPRKVGEAELLELYQTAF